MDTSYVFKLLFLLCGTSIVFSAEGNAQGLDCSPDLNCPVGKVCINGYCCQTCLYYNRQNGTQTSEKICVQSVLKDCGDCLNGYRVRIVGINDDNTLKYSDTCQLYSMNVAHMQNSQPNATESPDIDKATGMIIGGVVLGVAVVAGISFLIYGFFGKRMRQKKSKSKSPEEDSQPESGELQELNPQPLVLDPSTVTAQKVEETD